MKEKILKHIASVLVSMSVFDVSPQEVFEDIVQDVYEYQVFESFELLMIEDEDMQRYIYEIWHILHSFKYSDIENAEN